MAHEKLDRRQAWHNTWRAMKIWWKIRPGLMIFTALLCIVKETERYAAIYFAARLLGELAGNRDPQQILVWAVLALGSAGVLSLLGGLLTRLQNYHQSAAERCVQRVFMDKMLSMDFAVIDRQAVYDLYTQIQQNDTFMGFGLSFTLLLLEPMLTAIFRILGGIGLSVSLFLQPVPAGNALAFLNHPLAVAAMLALLLALAVLSSLSGAKSTAYWAEHASDGTLGNRIFNFFCSMTDDRSRAPDIRIYNQQENVLSVNLSMQNIFGPGSSLANVAKGVMGGLLALSRGLMMLMTGVIYLFVCLKAWGGAFGVGEVSQYVGAITNLFLGITGIFSYLGQLRNNASFLSTVYSLLDLPNEMYQGSLTTEKRSDRKYEIEFRDVSFRYPGSDAWALRHVNLKFQVGSRLAVVGRNGSGKTTFIKLLCRLYDPTEGEIRLNGIDIRKYRYEDYLSLFSVVFQDFKLLALPLGENVAAEKTYEKARVTQCLQKAGFGQRLSELPQGLETYLYKELKKDGVDVSGGEAQKIALARALYRDAPFIILDEPTAALDPVAEAQVYERFNAILEDKTAVYISHRLSSCKFCDEIAVFDQGEVVQKGTHASLMAEEQGLYHALFTAQAQYYVTSQKESE